MRGMLFSRSSTTRSAPCCRWMEEGVRTCSDPQRLRNPRLQRTAERRVGCPCGRWHWHMNRRVRYQERTKGPFYRQSPIGNGQLY
jgi:hypothetical protein